MATTRTAISSTVAPKSTTTRGLPSSVVASAKAPVTAVFAAEAAVAPSPSVAVAPAKTGVRLADPAALPLATEAVPEEVRPSASVALRVAVLVADVGSVAVARLQDTVEGLGPADVPVPSGLLVRESLGETTSVAARRITPVPIIDAILSLHPSAMVPLAPVLVQPGSVGAPHVVELSLLTKSCLCAAVVGG